MKPTIVVPLDGSDNAEQALPYARALAQRSGGSLLLVTIVDIPIEFGAWSMASAGIYGIELERWEQESETYLQRIAGEQGDTETQTIVRVGSPAAEIREIVKVTEDPVVVTTSHGRTGVKRMFLGSVASKLVRDLECPVLVVRIQEQATPPQPGFDRLLVPLDGSPFSEEGLDQAVALFGEGLTIHLLRVIEMPRIPATGMADGGLSMNYGLIEEYTAATRDMANEYMRVDGREVDSRGTHRDRCRPRWLCR